MFDTASTQNEIVASAIAVAKKRILDPHFRPNAVLLLPLLLPLWGAFSVFGF
jgi:hypothetical protein